MAREIDVERRKVVLEMTGNATDLNRTLRSVDKATRQTAKNTKTLSDGFGRLKTAMKGLGALYAVNQLIAFSRSIITFSRTIAEAADQIDLLRLQAEGLGGGAEGFDKLYASAQRMGIPLADIGQQLNVLAPALGKLGVSFDGTIDFSEKLTKSLRLFGVQTMQANSIVTQLGQALNSGQLSGDELKSLSENAAGLFPAFGKAIQNILKTETSIKDLGSQSKLTADIVYEAFNTVFDDLEDRFAELPDTLANQEARMSNAATKLFASLDDALHVSDIWEFFISGLTDAIEGANRLLTGWSQAYLGGTALEANRADQARIDARINDLEERILQSEFEGGTLNWIQRNALVTGLDAHLAAAEQQRLELRGQDPLIQNNAAIEKAIILADQWNDASIAGNTERIAAVEALIVANDEILAITGKILEAENELTKEKVEQVKVTTESAVVSAAALAKAAREAQRLQVEQARLADQQARRQEQEIQSVQSVMRGLYAEFDPLKNLEADYQKTYILLEDMINKVMVFNEYSADTEFPFDVDELSKGLLLLDRQFLENTESLKQSEDAYDSLGNKMRTFGELVEDVAKNAVGAIQATLSNTFQDIFSGALDSGKDFLKSLKDLLLKGVADIAAALLTKSIVVPIVGGLIGGTVASSATSSTASAVSSAVSSATSSPGGFFEYWKSNSIGESLGKTMAEGFGKVFENDLPGWLSTGIEGLKGTSNAVLGASAGLGALAGALIFDENYGEIGAGIGAAVGTAIGAALTSWSGGWGAPIGGAIGGLLGGLVGSAFGSKDQAKVAYGRTSYGELYLADTDSIDADTLKELNATTAGLNQALKAFAETLGPEAQAALANSQAILPYKQDPANIGRWLDNVFQTSIAAMTGAIGGSIGKVTRELFALANGEMEKFAADLELLGTSLADIGYALNTIRPGLVADIEDAAYLLDKVGVQYAPRLASGLKSLAGLMEDLKSEEEKLADATAQAQRIFNTFGGSIPTSVEGLRGLVDSLDLTTEYGLRFAAALGEIAPQMDLIIGTATDNLQAFNATLVAMGVALNAIQPGVVIDDVALSPDNFISATIEALVKDLEDAAGLLGATDIVVADPGAFRDAINILIEDLEGATSHIDAADLITGLKEDAEKFATQTQGLFGSAIDDLIQDLEDAAGLLGGVKFDVVLPDLVIDEIDASALMAGLAGLAGLMDGLKNEEEKLADATAQVHTVFNEFGGAMPTTVEGLRALVDGLDLTTENGLRFAAALGDVAPQMNTVIRAAESLDSLDSSLEDVAGTLQSFVDALVNITTKLAETRQGIEEFGLQPEEIYKRRKAEADLLMDALGQLIDPTQILGTVDKINSLIDEGWGILDAGQKEILKGSFLSYIDEIDALATERLGIGFGGALPVGDVDVDLSGSMQEFASVMQNLDGSLGSSSERMGDASDEMREAGARMIEAAQLFVAAANGIPSNLTVTVTQPEVG